MLFTARLYRPFLPVVYCSSIWSLITIVPLCVDPLYAIMGERGWQSRNMTSCVHCIRGYRPHSP